MRTLVFGGTGMLGSAVAVEGRRRGWPTLALTRAQGEVTDGAAVLAMAAAFRPQLVVNCAAFTRVDDCEAHPEQAFAVNGAAVANLAAAARALDAQLLQVSTDYVFDGAADHPYREDAPTAPLSVYGASKLAGEHAALAHPRAAVVRTSWLFGPGGANFAATIVKQLAAGRPLRVVRDQIGCPTYTPFLARALCDLAARSVTGVVHYRNREAVSWHGFASAIADTWHRANGEPVPAIAGVPTTEFPRPATRPAYSVLDVGRFESAVGRPVEPWSAGLAEYLDLIRNRRH
jgi:dTDP-4-dehydrorhamnose reductase